jgi:hypothetical protein
MMLTSETHALFVLNFESASFLTKLHIFQIFPSHSKPIPKQPGISCMPCSHKKIFCQMNESLTFNYNLTQSLRAWRRCRQKWPLIQFSVQSSFPSEIFPPEPRLNCLHFYQHSHLLSSYQNSLPNSAYSILGFL